VQDRIAATTLVFSALNISAPRGGVGAGAGADFTISVAAVLSGISPVDGVLNPFTATLSHAGVAVATFPMPSLAARAGVDNALAISAPVTLLSSAAFTTFGAALVLSDAVTIDLSGVLSVSTVVAGSRITVYDVNFAKSVTIAGAGGLRHASVTSFSLANSTPTAAVADLVVVVANPSVVRIDPLGDLAADVFFEGARVGRVLARDAVLAPGASTLRLSGPLVNSNATVTNALISAYLSNRTVLVTARASTSALSASRLLRRSKSLPP
jgi:hypothetical protein